jgi:predicted transcriptional regulator
MTAAASQHLTSDPGLNNPSPIPTHVTLSAEERVEMRRRRRIKGITLKTIAWRIGVNPGILAKYQCGERRPPVWVVEAWLRELA